jgi:hypothetical protein
MAATSGRRTTAALGARHSRSMTCSPARQNLPRMVARVVGSPTSTVIGGTWYDRRNDTHNLRFAAGRPCSSSVPMQAQDRMRERDRRERCIGVLPRRTRRGRQSRGPSSCLAFLLPAAPRAWWRAARSGRAANSSTSRTGGVQLGNLSLPLSDTGIQAGSPIRRPTPSGRRAGSRHPAAGLPAENGDSRKQSPSDPQKSGRPGSNRRRPLGKLIDEGPEDYDPWA